MVRAERVLGMAAGIGVLAVVLSAAPAASQGDEFPWEEQAKLLAGDGAAGDGFGEWAVAVNGDTAVVGAWADDDRGTDSGSAYVFVRSGSTWTQQAKLLAGDGAAGDYFGWPVDIRGDTAVIGACGVDDAGADSGAAYVFVRSGETWTQQARLTAGDAAAGDWFGGGVSISGETVLVGAKLDDDAGADSGAAYVFVRSGSTWSQQAKLLAGDGAGGDQFGWGVSVAGDTALVGAWGDDDAGAESGAAYVFVRSGSTWTQQARLTASDAAAGDRFGWGVSLSGDTALVAAGGDDDAGADAGAAYVFVWSGSTWTQQAKLLASDGAAGDYFGEWAVSVSGDTAVMGACGGGWGDKSETVAGSAYVFVRSGTTWTEQTELTASDGAAGDYFGGGVSISGDTVLVGATHDDDSGADSGSAYVYDGALALGDNTAAGTDVDVEPVDPNTGTTPVTLTFETVTEEGTTSVTTSKGGAQPPLGFKLGQPPVYHEITTTATFEGTVQLCFSYGSLNFGSEEQLTVFHYEDTDGDGTADTWVPLETLSQDLDHDVICVEATSLSPFLVSERYDLQVIDIDIKPGSSDNTINLQSAGVIPVVLLGSSTFDASQVDPVSIYMAGAGVKVVGNGEKALTHLEDVNGDGFDDLDCQIQTAEIILQTGESRAVLNAEMVDGTLVGGEDTIRIVHE